MTEKEKFNSFKDTSKKYFENDEYTDINRFDRYILKLFIEDISDDDINSGLYGLGSNDGGVDFCYEADGKVYLCQIKATNSYKCDNRIQVKDLDYFKNYTDNIKNKQWLNTKSQAVKDIADTLYSIDNENIVRMFFIMGKVDDRHYSLAKDAKIQVYGWDDIYDKHNESMQKNNGEEYVSGDCYVECREDTSWQSFKHANNRYAYFGVIKAESLVKMHKDFGYTLYDQNIRYSLTSSKVNTQMKDTIVSKPSNFYFYNNGVTITCTKVGKPRKNNTELEIKNPSIINGAQTVNTIVNTTKQEHKDNIKDINILCRIITRADGDHTFVQNLTRYNNTHNPVKEIDFLSKRAEQNALHSRFYNSGIFYEHRRGILNKKEIKEDIKKGIIESKVYKLNITKLMQILLSCGYENDGNHWIEQKPDVAKCGVKNILTISINKTRPSNEYFYYIFGKKVTESKIKDIRNEIESISQQRFTTILLCVKIFKAIEGNISIFEKCLNIRNRYQNNQDELGIYQNLAIEIKNSKPSFLSNRSSDDLKTIFDAYYYIVDAKFLILTVVWYIIHKADNYQKLMSDMSQENINGIINNWFYQLLLTYFRGPCEDIEKNKINFKNYFKKEQSWTDIQKEIKFKNVQYKVQDLFKIK
jgi:hypothetical protein